MILIILLDVAVGLIKDIFILDFIFDPNNTAKSFFDLLLSGRGTLPSIEAHNFYNTVYVGYDPLNNDRGTTVFQTVKKFSQCSDTFIDFLLWYNLFFGLCSFFSQFE